MIKFMHLVFKVSKDFREFKELTASKVCKDFRATKVPKEFKVSKVHRDSKELRACKDCKDCKAHREHKAYKAFKELKVLVVPSGLQERLIHYRQFLVLPMAISTIKQQIAQHGNTTLALVLGT
jgi:hypothetical protein